MSRKNFSLFVDTGGTFTDCIAEDSNGNIIKKKVLSNGSVRGSIVGWRSDTSMIVLEQWKLEKDILEGYNFKLLNKSHPAIRVMSYEPGKRILHINKALPANFKDYCGGFELSTGEEAPVLAARLITETRLNESIPVSKIKLGSTRGTNALLERKGSDTILFVTEGFRDLLEIRYQNRPDIFARNIIKPAPLYTNVIEVKERIDAGGNVLEKMDIQDFNKKLEKDVKRGEYDSAAIAFINSYKNPVHEQELKKLLQEYGFSYISISSELSQLIKYLPRAETAMVNAYLDAIIQNYLNNISAKLGPISFHVMNSAGGLMRKGNFNPKDSLLSGPSGGVVGAAATGKAAGYENLISFDMGGTSTDVSRISGKYDYKFELEIGDARIFSPALSIETVAAGGGSICYYDGFKLSVGPESAGAFPGPACYGAGGPLTITDINLLAGRMDADQFSIPVYPGESDKKLEELVEEIYSRSGSRRQKEELLNGFLLIANEIMAAAIRKVSVSKGYKPADHAMVAFGGAGGMHACTIAELLDISIVLLPLNAGLLSAYGISRAGIERIAERQVLKDFYDIKDELNNYFSLLDKEAIGKITEEGEKPEDVVIKDRYIYLRFRGQDSALEVTYDDITGVIPGFKSSYERTYGHWTESEEIEVESIRVIASTVKNTGQGDHSTQNEVYPEYKHKIRSLLKASWIDAPVYFRKELPAGAVIKGFALVLDEYSTWVVEDDWILKLDAEGTAVIKKAGRKEEEVADNKGRKIAEEIELELFTNRFMHVAMNMGSMLQRTSVSVNVKERLDFSCALLNENGELVANAPHIPVHLGSLGVCVRAVASKYDMGPGDTIITNHPAYGGSHLPDITLITPVFTADDELVGYVVNRAHHAEIGGILPGSMPPDASCLAEEGVVISPIFLVRNNKANWGNIRNILSSGTYPSRAVDENIADLNAALAANRAGERELLKLVEEHGREKVKNYMKILESYAENRMRETIKKIPDGKYSSIEYLDDGTAISVEIDIRENSCKIDFSGNSEVHPGNMNATEAIVNGVTIYVLRLLINEDIPLNDGLLKPVELVIPEGLLNPDFSGTPEQCPAIVGGNVELSQRLTDLLLKPFGILACSQGTMNNVLFGNKNLSYYETICGGCGAGDGFDGASAVHHHMTNTRITDPEIMEHRYPVVLNRFEIRKGSGGKGRYRGGDGVIRELKFLDSLSLSVLSQHRNTGPYGLNGGEDGKPGEQYIIYADGRIRKLGSIDGAEVGKGDVFVIKTPGGGAFGS